MKTTVDIPDGLLDKLKQQAARERKTLRDLIQAAIQQFLTVPGKRPGPFRLRDASVGGRGMAQGVQEGDWSQVRELAYEGRGGADGGARAGHSRGQRA